MDAATIPNSFVTAFYTLFNQLGLPVPTSFPVTESPPLSATPILVYGAGSSVGSYVVQLLGLAGYKNIIVTASQKHHSLLHGMGATHTFDYHSNTLVEEIGKVTGGRENLNIALDCIAAESTLNIIAKVLSPTGKLAILLPIKEGENVTNGKDQALHLEIPAGKNPFTKETQTIGVRTLLYEKVSHDDHVYTVIGSDFWQTGHLLGQQFDAKNPFNTSELRLYQTKSGTFTGSRDIRREGFSWFGAYSK